MPIDDLSLTRPAQQRRGGLFLPTVLIALIGGAMLATYAVGQSDETVEMDADGDGLVSYTELLMVMPDVTEDEFAALDANADGGLDATELAVAVEAGLIPAG